MKRRLPAIAPLTTTLVVLPVVGGSPSDRAGAVSDPVVVVAGDISCGPADPNFSGSNAMVCQQRATAGLGHSLNPDYLLPRGRHPVPTSTGKSYWMIGSDGGVFAFGDAGFVGSLPGVKIHMSNIVAFARH
jgi:hypothetical protein